MGSSILLSILLLQDDGASRTLRVQACLTPNPGLLFDELLRNGWRSIVPCALEPPVLEAGEGTLSKVLRSIASWALVRKKKTLVPTMQWDQGPGYFPGI